MKGFKPKTIQQRLDYYIEFAETLRRFSDVGFYKEVKSYIDEQCVPLDYHQTCIDEAVKQSNLKLLEELLTHDTGTMEFIIRQLRERINNE